MRKTIYLLFSTVFILILIEFISLLILRNDSLPFLINNSNRFNVDYLKGFGFNEIHPFTGWRMSDKTLKEAGFNEENGFITLEYNNNEKCKKIKIFITGGSTSDIVLDKNNWPISLSALLKEKNICFKIYMGSVGGYHSGQEFLQLITFLHQEKPDFHISYSGANDFGNLFYVSEYENEVFKTLFKPNSMLLPNTVKLFKSELKYDISEIRQIESFQFWKENMEKMQALANFYNYTFISILQPVINYSGLNEDSTMILESEFDYFLNNYDAFYPNAKDFAKSTEYIYDFTNAFLGFNENVFLDDCHLKREYQHIIAGKIFKLLEKKTNEVY